MYRNRELWYHINHTIRFHVYIYFLKIRQFDKNIVNEIVTSFCRIVKIKRYWVRINTLMGQQPREVSLTHSVVIIYFIRERDSQEKQLFVFEFLDSSMIRVLFLYFRDRESGFSKSMFQTIRRFNYIRYWDRPCDFVIVELT